MPGMLTGHKRLNGLDLDESFFWLPSFQPFIFFLSGRSGAPLLISGKISAWNLRSQGFFIVSDGIVNLVGHKKTL